MGLFDKKNCDICGKSIGLLGNRKLEDGNCCKDCAKKLSPWFDERRNSTVAQIKQQLAYRETNKSAVANFRVSRTYGYGYTKLYLDESARKLAIGGNNFRDDNADVVDFSQITAVNLDVKDYRRELKQQNAEGNMVSYNPPRYEYEYDFYVVFSVNHPWFNEMKFQLNKDKLVIQELGSAISGILVHQSTLDPHMNYDYASYENMSKEITSIIMGTPYTPQPVYGQTAMGMGNMGAMGMGNMGAMGMGNMGAMGMGTMGNTGYMSTNEAVNAVNMAMGMAGINNSAIAYDAQGQPYVRPMSNPSAPAGMVYSAQNPNMGYDMQYQQQYQNGMNMQNAQNPAMGYNNMPQQTAAYTAPVQQPMQTQGYAQAQPAAANGKWVCACGAENTGSFCEYCGAPRP